jgi:O-antigen ligase
VLIASSIEGLASRNLSRKRAAASSRFGALDVLIGLAIFGTALQAFQFGPGLSVVDPVIAVGILAATPYLLTPGNAGHRLFRRSLPWIWIFVLGHLFGLIGVGLTTWAVSALLRNLGAFAAFFAFFAVCVARPAARRLGWFAFFSAFAFVAMSVFVHSSAGLRASGVFDNANYPGHFLATGVTVLMFAGHWRVSSRAIGIGVGLLGIIATGSFGALTFVAVVVAYWMWSRGARLRTQLRVSLRLLCVVISVVLVILGFGRVSVSEVNTGSGIDAARFARSSDARGHIWSEAIAVAEAHPLGVGPGGFHARQDLGRTNQEIAHNDYLEVLVGGGVVALLGFAGLLLVLWRASRPAKISRALLLGFGTAAVFRDTVNFRHLWLVLALALATEIVARQRRGAAL